MCHSVRKSFMSALYGIFWDRGEIELNPENTNAEEMNARIRSGGQGSE